MQPVELMVTLRGKSFGELVSAAENFIEASDKVTAKSTTGKRRAAATTTTDDDEILDEDTTDDTTTEETDTDEQMEFDMDGSDDEETLDETEEETRPKKTTKGKITDKQVNQACIAHAKKHGRKKTSAILAKKFKVKSVLELKTEQYGAVIAALKA